MTDIDRFKLLFGPYQMPRCRIRGLLRCRRRSCKVRVHGISSSPIQWPFTRQATGRGRPSLILCGDLIRAVQRESEVAIAHWWGVSISVVLAWRRVLGVEADTEGGRDLRRRLAPETCQSEKATEKLTEVATSPEQRAKISAALKGKPKLPHVREALLRASVGRKVSEATRSKMRAAAIKIGAYPPAAGPPWSAEEDALLGTMTDCHVGHKIGRTDKAVSARRYVLKVPAFVKRKPRAEPVQWTSKMDKLLGTMPDTEVARRLRCDPMAVFHRRKRLKIVAYRWR